MSLPADSIAREAFPIFSYTFTYFPDAYLAEVTAAVAGNDQHNPGEPLHWAREKSTDHMNKAFRHVWDYGTGVKKDTDGCWHLAKAIWRLKAQLQLDIEAERFVNSKLTAIPDWRDQIWDESGLQVGLSPLPR